MFTKADLIKAEIQLDHGVLKDLTIGYKLTDDEALERLSNLRDQDTKKFIKEIYGRLLAVQDRAIRIKIDIDDSEARLKKTRLTGYLEGFVQWFEREMKGVVG
jgi:hypothetical protein